MSNVFSTLNDNLIYVFLIILEKNDELNGKSISIFPETLSGQHGGTKCIKYTIPPHI